MYSSYGHTNIYTIFIYSQSNNCWDKSPKSQFRLKVFSFKTQKVKGMFKNISYVQYRFVLHI